MSTIFDKQYQLLNNVIYYNVLFPFEIMNEPIPNALKHVLSRSEQKPQDWFIIADKYYPNLDYFVATLALSFEYYLFFNVKSQNNDENNMLANIRIELPQLRDQLFERLFDYTTKQKQKMGTIMHQTQFYGIDIHPEIKPYVIQILYIDHENYLKNESPLPPLLAISFLKFIINFSISYLHNDGILDIKRRIDAYHKYEYKSLQESHKFGLIMNRGSMVYKLLIKTAGFATNYKRYKCIVNRNIKRMIRLMKININDDIDNKILKKKCFCCNSSLFGIKKKKMILPINDNEEIFFCSRTCGKIIWNSNLLKIF